MRTIRGLIAVSFLCAASCGDNDHPGGGELLVTPQTGLVTTDRGGTATFTVALTNQPWEDVHVALDSSNPLDGTVSPVSLTFTSQNYGTPQTVTVTGVVNYIVEGPQPYVVHVTADDTRIGALDVQVTNSDSDMPGVTVTPTSGLKTTAAGGTATFSVQLTSQPVAAVTIGFASSNTQEGNIDKSSLMFDGMTWNQPQVITITGMDDGQLNGDVAYSIVSSPTASSDPNYNGVDPDDVQVTNINFALDTIEVDPTAPTIAKGTTQQFSAVGHYIDDNGNTLSNDITALATWTTDNAGVATVSNTSGSQGLANGVGIGTANITAAYRNKSGSQLLTVTAATLVSIQITPPDPSIAKGTKQQFTATGTYTDNSTQDLTTQVVWSTANSGVATISNAAGSQGLASSVDLGTTTVTATQGSISGQTSLTVTAATLASIDVEPANASIAKGTKQAYTATGVYTDGTTQDLTTQVTWSSSNQTIATISNTSPTQGVATGINVGTTNIGASLNGVSGFTQLTVTSAVLVSIDVTPTNPSIAKGTSVQFTAIGTYTDASTQDLTSQATWSSSDISVGTVSNAAGTKGLATGVGTGQTTIGATFGGVTGTTILTVTPATLVSIAITPPDPSIAKGTQLQFTATGTYTDNSTQDLTTQATWSSTLVTVATISNAGGSQGLATGTNIGATTISATFGGVTGATTLTVTAATLVSIEVTPTNPSIAKGTTLQFAATGTYTDGSTQDLTTQATWGSTTTTTATISNATGTQGLATAVDLGTTTISASFGGKQGTTTLTVTAATLVSIAVTPTSASIAKGTTLQYTAIGTYTDSSTQDLTTQATWSSSDPTVATISNAAGSQGLATAVNLGTTTISATFGGKTGSTDLTVTAATLVSIAVTPTNPSVAKGTTKQFTATGTYTDGSTQNLTTQVTWASSDTTVATISNASGTQGRASAVNIGATTISATFSGKTGSTTLTVTAATLQSIAVTPTNTSIAKGTTLQYTATGTFTDGSTQDLTSSVTWSSNMTTVATISNAAGSHGLATAVNTGTTTIRATLGGVNGTTTLTVTAATLVSIAVTPTNASIAKGTTLQYTAIGTYTDGSTQDLTTQATWASSNGSVATISNVVGSQGLASAANTGATTISATFQGKTGSTALAVTAATLASIAVTPTDPSIAKGTTEQFTATGTYTDGSTQDLTTQVTWASSDQNVATISNAAGTQGLATSVNTGTTTISATSGGVTGSTSLTVNAAVLAQIQVTPANASIAKGTTVQYVATGVYSDGSTQDLTTTVTWSSLTTTVATISNAAGTQGLATGVGTGGTTISATFGGVTGSTSLTVTAATLVSVQVSPTDPTIAKGTTLQFTCTGVYSDSSTQDLTTTATWSSSDTTVATISNAPGSQGLASGGNAGTTTIGCASGGKTNSTTLTVTAAVLTGVTVTPVNPNVAKGSTVQFTCTGNFSDGSTQDLTATGTWTSSDSTVATVSNAAGSQGLATAVAVGTANITCTSGGFSDFSTLTVTAATITSIVVSPTNPAIPKGVQLQFTAVANYSDGTVVDITDLGVWTSSNTNVATISNVVNFSGIATAVGIGTTTITVSYGGSSGSTVLTVDAATLVSIALTPVNPQIAKGTLIQMIATGTFSDGTTQDITTVATWTSSNTTVATISNAGGSQGVATGVAAGTSTLTATYQGKNTSTTITVTNATLVSIEILPANPTITVGQVLQLTAIGHFTDGTTQNLTLQVNWKSQNKQVAKISQARRTRGRLTGISVGTSIISATTLGITGTTTVTVQ